MSTHVTVELDEVKRVYLLIEKLHEFFHQPMNYENTEAFAGKNYQEIKELYYNVVWGWLPDDVKRDIEER